MDEYLAKNWEETRSGVGSASGNFSEGSALVARRFLEAGSMVPRTEVELATAC